MKHTFLKWSIPLIFPGVFFSCDPGPNGGLPDLVNPDDSPGIEEAFQATVDGQSISVPQDTAMAAFVLNMSNYERLVLRANVAGNAEFFYFVMPVFQGTDTTIQIPNFLNYFELRYTRNTSDIYRDISGSISISRDLTVSGYEVYSGIFSFTGENSQDSTDTILINQGSFTVARQL